ncbi:MAG: nucleotide exchange factor GrpE [Bacillota bacterium]
MKEKENNSIWPENDPGSFFAESQDLDGETVNNESPPNRAGEEAPAEPDPLEVLAKEKEALYDRCLRLQADFENFRKRARQEYLAAEDKAREELFVKLLPFWDDFQRALGEPAVDAASFQAGMEMIGRKFQQFLEDAGVKEIAPEGEQFNPNQHEALIKVTDGAHAPGTVVEELRKGYLYKGRVIRPSLVKVAGD